MPESASVRTFSEMDAVCMKLYNYTHDLRPFVPGADANENAAQWQAFEASLADDVPVLANEDGDCLAIPIPAGVDHDTQNRILLRLLRKYTSGESRVIVDGAKDSFSAVVNLRARFAGETPMSLLCALTYESTAAALVAKHAMLIKRIKDDDEEVSAKRQQQTLCDAISPKRVGSTFGALYTRWTLDAPTVATMYAELAKYAESNDLNNSGSAPLPSGRAFAAMQQRGTNEQVPDLFDMMHRAFSTNGLSPAPVSAAELPVCGMCGGIGHTALGWHGLPPCPTRGVDVDRLCTFCHRSGHLRNDCYTRREFGATGDTAATSCFGGRAKRFESDRTRSNDNWRDRDDRSRGNYGRERDTRPRGLRGAANRAGQALLPAPAAPPTNDDTSAVSGLSGTSLRSWGGGARALVARDH